MSRDHRKLRAFVEADRLVTEVYAVSRQLPATERYGLTSQMRRAAVSVACNIVEGSARRTEREYVNFLNIATASAAETRCLIEIAGRLGLLSAADSEKLCQDYSQLIASLKALVNALSPS